MSSTLLIHFLICLLTAAALKVTSSSGLIAKPGCNDTCGGVKIPFPFGMGTSDCFLDPWFEIECRPHPHSPTNHSKNGSINKPFLSKLDIELMEANFDMSSRQMLVRIPASNACTTSAAADPYTQTRRVKSIDLSGSPYNFDMTQNVFMMEGCPGNAVLATQNQGNSGGCGTVCHNTKNSPIPNKTCFGVHCCQTSVSDYYTQDTYYYVDFTLQPSGEAPNCLVASLIEGGSVNKYVGKLSSSDPSSFSPVVLSWTWPNDLAKDRPRNHHHVSCSSDDSKFFCECDFNYAGNPYVPDGCQAPKGCEGCRGYCLSTPRGSGYYCENGPILNLAAILGLTNSFGVLVLAACIYGLYRFIKRRREMRRRAKFFKRNGGLLLQQQLSSNEGVVERTKVFGISELDKATDHFNENRVLGQGGQGTVYKGMLSDGSIVAIKKAKLLDDENQLEQFVNEVVILSRVNHRHVVKLFGCCLETEVPLLVYEFIPNGTLFQHIHDPDEDFAITWRMRLKIAADSAGAIAYLHSSSSIPIYHRDIKSSNILLDEKHRAKVSDFGSSKTIAMDQTHMTTLVQGTMGYLDPEYFQSYQFTEKSDVYSFGVVILELLTSKKPIFRDASSMEQKNLVTEFLFMTQNSRLSNILDPKIASEAKEDELISIVELAKRCVSWSGKMRPTMKEVAMTLEMIMKSPAQVSSWYREQEDFPIQYAGYDEFDMSGLSDAEFVSTTLHPGDASPPYNDARPLLPDAN